MTTKVKTTKDTVKTESTTKAPKPKFVNGYKSVSKNLTSFHDPSFKYEIGKEAVVADADKNPRACGKGIHFSRNVDYPITFARGHKDFKILKLKVNKADIIASGSQKSRASKVFVVCEEKIVFPDYTAVNKEINTFGKTLGKVVCKATPAKLRGLFTKYCNADKLKGMTLQIIDSPFEAEHYAQRIFNGVPVKFASLYDCDGNIEHDIDDISYSLNSVFNNDCDCGGMQKSIESILTCYAKKVAEPTAKCSDTTPLFEMMKLGVIFLGKKKKNVIVFAPSTLPNKWFPKL